jgi:hypothetical protein
MFLHRVKMNWKKHQTLTLTILLVALARIVLESAFGEAPSSGYAVLKIGVRSAQPQRWSGRSSRPVGNWGPSTIRSSAPSWVLCADSAATTGVKRRQCKRHRSA